MPGKAELVFSGVTYTNPSLHSLSPEFRRASLQENRSVCPDPRLPLWKMGLSKHLHPELVLAKSVEGMGASIPSCFRGRDRTLMSTCSVLCPVF